jgi:hypothetical protein
VTPVFEPPVSRPLPPSPDDASTLWELLYESLGFHVEDDEDQDFALRKFCEALCTPMQPAYDLVREREDSVGWGIVFDADNCPAYALPYLAQYVGVQITPEMSEEQIRNEIREPTGWKRGQPESLRVATRRTLEGENPLVIIHTRTPSVGTTYIRTLLSQTPDPVRTEAVIRAVLPAWEWLDYEAITGPTFADAAASTDWSNFTGLKEAFATFRALTEITPEEL